MAAHTPSESLLVVHLDPRERQDAVHRLEPVGRLEPLAESGIYLLHVARSAGDAKAVWEKARELLAGGGTIQPVLVDDRGQAHYPTGEISVRFKQTPPDEQVRAFAAAHGLRPRDRNEFVPQQVVFQLTSPQGSYLPELVARLASSQEIKAAWANTLSSFQRV